MIGNDYALEDEWDIEVGRERIEVSIKNDHRKSVNHDADELDKEQDATAYKISDKFAF